MNMLKNGILAVDFLVCTVHVLVVSGKRTTKISSTDDIFWSPMIFETSKVV